MAAILKFAVRAGRPQVLIRWASGDTWDPLENLTTAKTRAIRDFERARGVVLPRVPPPPPSQVCGGYVPPLPPPGYSVNAAPDGAALVGRWILHFCRRTAGSSVQLRRLAGLGHPASPTSWPRDMYCTQPPVQPETKK